MNESPETLSSGDVIVDRRDIDFGNCAYCGDVVYGRVKISERGVTLHCLGALAGGLSLSRESSA